MTPEMAVLLKSLLEFASAASGLEAPREPPPIVFATRCNINRMMRYYAVEVPCRDIPLDAYALYDDENEIVYLPVACREFRTSLCRTAAVHEFVHYLQDVHGLLDRVKAADGCMSSLEPLAYQVGNAYSIIHEHGQDVVPGPAIFFLSQCPQRSELR